MLSPDLEFGLDHAFQSVANTLDEQPALFLAAASGDDTPSEITFLELQLAVETLCTVLYYRFGVRRGDPVAVLTHGHTAAEVVALLACVRLGAPFVPLDASAPGGRERMAAVVADARPVAAVVVGRDDRDPNVMVLTSLQIVYRCALLNDDGSCVLDDRCHPLFSTFIPMRSADRRSSASTQARPICPPTCLV